MIAGKAEKVVGDRVAKRIAEGQFDIGFQQISEIKPFTGKYGQVELVGPIPAPYQKLPCLLLVLVKFGTCKSRKRTYSICEIASSDTN